MNEREAFEAWFKTKFVSAAPHVREELFGAWQARAKLIPAQPSAAQGWMPISEAPEDTDVLGYFPDAWHKFRRFRKFTREGGGIVWIIETQSFSDLAHE